MNIGIVLKRIREGKGLSQLQLSEITGIPNTMISRFENGKQRPSIKHLDKLANAFELPSSCIVFLGLDVNDIKDDTKREAFEGIHNTMKRLIEDSLGFKI